MTFSEFAAALSTKSDTELFGDVPTCMKECGSTYWRNSHHPDCPRGNWEAERTCDGCHEVIMGNIYRCMDCTKPFHRVCLFKHCGKTHEAYLDALKGLG